VKYLLIVRHAQSSLDYNGFDDFKRPLTERGIKDAFLMGEKLIKNQFIPDYIISSGANRALETSRIIAEGVGHNVNEIKIENRIYNSSIDIMMELIQNISDDYSKVMIAGHNPILHYLSQTLTGKTILKFSPCTMICISFDIENWLELVNKGEKIFMIFPEMYR
tara:strand:- start:18 stop:509 length:492 start_codon:yes stop_codon:yes gene_type:complete